MKKFMLSSLPLLIVGLTIIILGAFYVEFRLSGSRKQYVIVDVDLISRHFVSKLITMNLEEAKYQKLLVEYDQTLTNVIEKIGEKNKFVIFKRSAILTKLPDITNDVEGIVFKELHL